MKITFYESPLRRIKNLKVFAGKPTAFDISYFKICKQITREEKESLISDTRKFDF